MANSRGGFEHQATREWCIAFEDAMTRGHLSEAWKCFCRAVLEERKDVRAPELSRAVIEEYLTRLDALAQAQLKWPPVLQSNTVVSNEEITTMWSIDLECLMSRVLVRDRETFRFTPAAHRVKRLYQFFNEDGGRARGKPMVAPVSVAPDTHD